MTKMSESLQNHMAEKIVQYFNNGPKHSHEKSYKIAEQRLKLSILRKSGKI